MTLSTVHQYRVITTLVAVSGLLASCSQQSKVNALRPGSSPASVQSATVATVADSSDDQKPTQSDIVVKDSDIFHFVIAYAAYNNSVAKSNRLTLVGEVGSTSALNGTHFTHPLFQKDFTKSIDSNGVTIFTIKADMSAKTLLDAGLPRVSQDTSKPNYLDFRVANESGAIIELTNLNLLDIADSSFNLPPKVDPNTGEKVKDIDIMNSETKKTLRSFIASYKNDPATSSLNPVIQKSLFDSGLLDKYPSPLSTNFPPPGANEGATFLYGGYHAEFSH